MFPMVLGDPRGKVFGVTTHWLRDAWEVPSRFAIGLFVSLADLEPRDRFGLPSSGFTGYSSLFKQRVGSGGDPALPSTLHFSSRILLDVGALFYSLLKIFF